MPDFNYTLQEIKSRGYWQVHVYPNSLSTIEVPINSLKDVARSSVIQLRGWDYPHLPTQNDEKQAIYAKGDAVEAWVNWEQFNEVWRLYRTGQFIHLFGLREDWLERNSWIEAEHHLKQIKPGSLLDIISANYSITEIYLFLKNLAEKGFYDEGLVVELKLCNVMKRQLQVLDTRRAPLFSSYTAMVKEVILPKREYTKEDILNRFLEIALEQTICICHQFNWDNPPIEVLKEDQKKLIERRI